MYLRYYRLLIIRVRVFKLWLLLLEDALETEQLNHVDSDLWRNESNAVLSGESEWPGQTVCEITGINYNKCDKIVIVIVIKHL